MKKNLILIFIITSLIAVLIESIFFLGRVYLNKNSVGFLIDFNFKEKKYIDDHCKRMITHPLLTFIHDTKNKCEVLGSTEHNDYFIYYEKKKEDNNLPELVIYTSGGSTTDGFYSHLSEGYTWPYQLQKICEIKYNCQVINGGNGGYSTSQELLKFITYETLLPKIDYVISLNGVNDIRTSRRTSGKNFENHPYLTKIQLQMFKKQNWVRQDRAPIILFPNVKSFFLYKNNHNANLKLNELILKKNINKIEKEKAINDIGLYAKIWEKNIEKFYSISTVRNAKFISLLQPFMGLNNVNINHDLKSIDKELLNSLKTNIHRKNMAKETNDLYNVIKDICLRKSFCKDISFVAPPGDNLWHDPRHHNEKGNKILAETIFNIIEKDFSK